MEIREWIICEISKENECMRRKKLGANLYVRNIIWLSQGLNPSLRCMKLANSHLSCATALCFPSHKLNGVEYVEGSRRDLKIDRKKKPQSGKCPNQDSNNEA
jgi:hypothetical protein